jgi:hypothetical protein
MSTAKRNPALYNLLRSQAIETLKILEKAIHNGAEVVRFQRGIWQRDAHQENAYSRHQISEPEYWILFHHHENAIQALPSFQNASNAVRCDAIWGKHMDTLVGSASGSSRIELNGLLKAFAYLSLKQTNSFDLSEECFNDLVSSYEKLFSSDLIRFVRYTPVYGIFINKNVIISDNIVIGSMTDAEISESMNSGVITSDFFGMKGDFIHTPPLVAIYSYFSLPKVIGDASQELAVGNLKLVTDVWNQLAVEETMLLDILTLILHNPVTP